MSAQPEPYVTIRARHPDNGSRASSADSTYGSGASDHCPTATHDTSRASYHVKHLDKFAESLQDSANKAFPNRGRASLRYKKVQALLIHWKCDDLFVLPELEDLEKCMREDYSFETDIFPIPSDNSHLELMMRIGALIKEHEANDTLLLVYYGGHARIDESRQSTWCATRYNESPTLQWSAIQTLLERSVSDVLILLDCCAGAASATFPSGQSITETISASSWDAIAPDPGRYSFTNALIEVLQEWRMRTFSAAMMHAEVLARLKHPRAITINGKRFEARSTPVHFMMTANHKAPSIEICRLVPDSKRPPSPPLESPQDTPSEPIPTGRGFTGGTVSDPNEDDPHVMISLALEDDQRLDLAAWQQWLSSFPALAKYVKVQGVFKSHSTLLLLSMPIMVWDLIPEDHACNFVAFIRSNNLIKSTNDPDRTAAPVTVPADQAEEVDRSILDAASIFSGTTYNAADDASTMRPSLHRSHSTVVPGIASASGVLDTRSLQQPGPYMRNDFRRDVVRPLPGGSSTSQASLARVDVSRLTGSTPSLGGLVRHNTSSSNLSALTMQDEGKREDAITRTMIFNQTRSSKRTAIVPDRRMPDRPPLANHVVRRLEEYFQMQPQPNVAVTEFLASNLGVDVIDIDLWFHHRRQRQLMNDNLQNLRIDDPTPKVDDGSQMILPGHLNSLLEIYTAREVLLVDLRSHSAFERSHVYRAVNLRAPMAFLRESSVEMVEKAFADDESRRTFRQWPSAKCIVFYDSLIEFSRECPAADCLYEKLKGRSWHGRCYILKGHYQEFALSFDKYIAGDRMTQAGKDYIDSLRQRESLSTAEQNERDERYLKWLEDLENDVRLSSAARSPARDSERSKGVENHQKQLEAEFKARFPALFDKVVGLRPASAHKSEDKASEVDMSDEKGQKDRIAFAKEGKEARLAEPLARGMERMQEAVLASPDGLGGRGPGGGRQHHASDEYAAKFDKLGEMSPGDERDRYEARDDDLKGDPALYKAGNSDAVDDEHRKGRERSFWKRLPISRK